MFDDELPPHELVGENAITNETSAETALNGIFSNLQGYGTMSANYICDNEYRTGLLTGTYRGTFETDGLLGFKLTEEYSYVADPWELAYKMVNREPIWREPENGNAGRGQICPSIRPRVPTKKIRVFLGYKQPSRTDHPSGTFIHLE